VPQQQQISPLRREMETKKGQSNCEYVIHPGKPYPHHPFLSVFSAYVGCLSPAASVTMYRS
jgi:hypothetical protein